ncbi:ArsR/SmtB family transcription factor [Tsuneonella sp. SYSU-LHT278]|uniref:ArsR/SmtB family transcription factor n=1 Tax=Tsuneonella sediminis TaxID=3416089 RepID=UPI003F79B2CE
MDLPLEIMEANAGRASSLLKSMANEARLMILCQLSQQEMTVSELARTVPLSQSALSQHLSVLRRERLVKTRRESQFVWYSLDSDAAKAVIGTLYDLFCAPSAGQNAAGTAAAER